MSEIGHFRIKPVLPSKEVIAFFETYLPTGDLYRSDCFFVNSIVDENGLIENEYIVINSMDEQRSKMSCSSEECIEKLFTKKEILNLQKNIWLGNNSKKQKNSTTSTTVE